jgi:hypothetical protein
MANFAKGSRSLAISDRSGMQFPYNEMVKEWNGSIVHFSEFEAKHPQLEIRSRGGDPQGLQRARPDTSRGTGIIASLDLQYWPGQFLSNGMQPGTSPDVENAKRQAGVSTGEVTIAFPINKALVTGSSSTSNLGSVTITT